MKKEKTSIRSLAATTKLSGFDIRHDFFKTPNLSNDNSEMKFGEISFNHSLIKEVEPNKNSKLSY